MKVMIVVGARPNFMKAAPILSAIAKYNRSASELIEPILVHTGQHYDALMSDSFFADLSLPKPDIHLGVGSGSHAAQTADIMKKFEEVLLSRQPHAVVVVGDVNSTVACSLVTTKVTFNSDGRRPLLAHVEAGLRSFDRAMPEECNRIVTDHLSDLLFVTEESGLLNLQQEGIAVDRTFFVGNTMIDSLLAFKGKADASTILGRLGLRAGTGAGEIVTPYALLTLHRPANVDNPATFLEIIEGLQDLAETHPIIFPAHPRTQQRIREHQLGAYFYFPGQSGNGANNHAAAHGISAIDPLGYLDFLCLMKHASLVVTDSGGIQEETTCLGVSCVTVRENTERPVTLTQGTNVVAGIHREGIRKAIRHQLGRVHRNSTPEKWDGEAAARIVQVLVRQLRQGGLSQQDRCGDPRPVVVTAN